MRKRDALRLKPGSTVIFAPDGRPGSLFSGDWDGYDEAEVVHVTQNAGIKVERRGGEVEWIKYVWVHSADKDPPSWKQPRRPPKQAEQTLRA